MPSKKNAEKAKSGSAVAPVSRSESVVVRRRSSDGSETRGVVRRAEAAPVAESGEARFAAFHDMLGKVSDSEIAALSGVPAVEIAAARTRRGIAAMGVPAVKRGRGRPPKGTEIPTAGLDKMLARLGKEPDDTIARELGIPRTSVGAYRRKKNIPGYRGHYDRGAIVPAAAASKSSPAQKAVVAERSGKLDAYKSQIGVKPDAEIAALAGISVSGVRKWRARHNVPAPKASSAAPPAAAKATAKAAAPAAAKTASAAASGRSRLDQFAHLMGVESDARVAELAGVTVSGVRKYRARRRPGTPLAAPVVASPHIGGPQGAIPAATGNVAPRQDVAPKIPFARSPPWR